MQRASPSGTSLVELLLTLVMVEIAAAFLLAALLGAARVDRRLRAGQGIDRARQLGSIAAARDTACRGAGPPSARSVPLPSGPGRPPILVVVRCGR
jgi:type II secretory pathway pseudopilin PulG